MNDEQHDWSSRLRLYSRFLLAWRIAAGVFLFAVSAATVYDWHPLWIGAALGPLMTSCYAAGSARAAVNYAAEQLKRAPLPTIYEDAARILANLPDADPRP